MAGLSDSLPVSADPDCSKQESDANLEIDLAISAQDQLMGDSGVRGKVQRIEANLKNAGVPTSKGFGKLTSGAVSAVAKVSEYGFIGGALKLGIGAAKAAGTAAKKGKKYVKGLIGDIKMEFEADFKLDFLSTCEAVDKRLRSLHFKYKLLIPAADLDETRKQFMEKQILISVLGCQNIGKSTLLNSLLRARILPAKEGPETGPKVLIQDSRDASINTAAAIKEPILKMKYVKQQSEVATGATAIYKKLESLNTDVRNSDQHQKEIPKCTLVTSVPFLADAPPEWKVSLVDTPGFGEFQSRVETLATEALKSSSAYVYITTYSELHTKANADYLRFIYQHDHGVFDDNRLIIVITKFDLVRVSQSEDITEEITEDPAEEITEDKVKEATCLSVSKACDGARISPDNVIPVSGRWAYQARMLAKVDPESPNHKKFRQIVVKGLEVCDLTCGQGEKPSTSLVKLGDHELSTKLEGFSGITNLEARIKTMTKSCVKIWVSKMRGDYERYMKQTVDKMNRESRDLSEKISRRENEHQLMLSLLVAIDEPRKELDDSITSHEKSQVYEEIAAKYPEDLEISKPQQYGKRVVVQLVTAFRDQCLGKVKDRKVEFGPHQLEADMKEFLEAAAKELEATFNSTCAFLKIHQVLMKCVGEMREDIQLMRGNAQLLCGHQRRTTTLQRTTTAVKTTQMSEEKTQESLSWSQQPDGDEKPLMAPNLGNVKEKVKIPAVSLSIWRKFANYCSTHALSFFAFWRRVFKRETTEQTSDHNQSQIESESKDDDFNESKDEDFNESKDEDLQESKDDDSRKSKDSDSSDAHNSSASEQTEPASYRSWNKELESCVKILQEFLEEECEAYFVNIKKHAIKYFYNQYCHETKTRLAAFDAEFKEDIDKRRRELKQLEKTIHQNCTELEELDKLRSHIVTLIAYLDSQADEYLQNIHWQKNEALS